MKLLCLLFLFLLSSCSRSVEVSYEEGKLTPVYAIENKSGNLCLVSIEYTIENEYHLFDLYTIYQNYLPEGYHSSGSPNVTLLNAYVQNQEIYYIVDRYILLGDIKALQEMMCKTAMLYDYKNVHFILDQHILL